MVCGCMMSCNEKLPPQTWGDEILPAFAPAGRGMMSIT